MLEGRWYTYGLIPAPRVDFPLLRDGHAEGRVGAHPHVHNGDTLPEAKTWSNGE